MTVFASFKKSRQAAKEHKAKQAEQEKKDDVKPAYRHVPSHAAIDALNATPQAWRHEDAPRIVEANRRHSERAASGYGRVSSFMSLNATQFLSPSGVTTPRVGSSLSHVAYPSGYASPVVQMPRTYSTQSLQPPASGWARGGGDYVSPYLRRAETDGPPMPSLKGKGKAVERASATPDLGRTGVVTYSSDSTSSQDDLEMPGGSRNRARAGSNGSQSSPKSPKASSSAIPHRLHPARRISDPPAPLHTRLSQQHPPRGDSYYPPSASAGRPGPRRSNPVSPVSPTSSGIPPVPAPPRGLAGLTSSTHSLSSHSSGFTNRSADPADTPTTAPSPDLDPTEEQVRGTKSSNNEQSTAETYADVIPDFAPPFQSYIDSAPKPGTATSGRAPPPQQPQRPPRPDEPRVTNFSRLSIRSTSSITRDAPRPTAPPQVQAPAPTRPPSHHASKSFERATVKPSTLPTRFIESGFDESPPQTAQRSTPKQPVSAEAVSPPAKGRRLTKRTSVAPEKKEKEKAPEKEKKRSLWGRR